MLDPSSIVVGCAIGVFGVSAITLVYNHFVDRDDFSGRNTETAKTIVYLRDLKSPAKHWEQPVLYDAWGSPYVAKSTYGLPMNLFCDGTTGDTYLRGTEWRLKSGPPVTFPERRPSKPFEDVAG